jgi:hypothetical protein
MLRKLKNNTARTTARSSLIDFIHIATHYRASDTCKRRSTSLLLLNSSLDVIFANIAFETNLVTLPNVSNETTERLVHIMPEFRRRFNKFASKMLG